MEAQFEIGTFTATDLDEYMDEVAALAEAIAWQIAKDDGQTEISPATFRRAFELAVLQVNGR